MTKEGENTSTYDRKERPHKIKNLKHALNHTNGYCCKGLYGQQQEGITPNRGILGVLWDVKVKQRHFQRQQHSHTSLSSI